MSEIKRALLSVYNKKDIVKLAKVLSQNGIDIISTGGTAKKLKKSNIDLREISDITNFPEMMDGRVKTLHPKIHGAILARRNNNEDQKEIEKFNIKPIDLVVCNLYPFAETIDRVDIDFDTIIENIDIGGPTMIRAAAKNLRDVLIVTDPSDYQTIIKKIKNKKHIDLEFRKMFAFKAFNHTAEYDSIIQEYFFNQTKDNYKFPEIYIKPYYKKMDLRYGENPHQKAAFYRERNNKETSITNTIKVIGDKELSFNNINDTDAAIELLKEFDKKPTVAIIKHTNPCGLASADNIIKAFKRAYSGDPLSSFGSIIALNRSVNKDTAQELVKGNKFIEVIVAPNYSDQACNILYNRWNSIRMLKVDTLNLENVVKVPDFKKVNGGLLVQDRDLLTYSIDDLKQVTKNKVNLKTKKDMVFAYKAVKHVKSNAIVIVKDEMIVGVGAGQMSRIDSMIIAGRKSKGRSKGAVVASDAFLPFPDTVKKAAKLNIKAIIQPGGSIRDKEVIKRADKLGIAMYFINNRHFLH
ncbi:MAG: bifunctional phosphoribosylaminoimidazolecarboxamide formyltransferase/IMP cyclohydrolase [Halanaerobiales bacterium]|nr:bifunctional phosphoribosylaminoimidazolecarboxamide formyltransferase/IMP cyclohydrolase [Halanaerobiales bacterium]